MSKSQVLNRRIIPVKPFIFIPSMAYGSRAKTMSNMKTGIYKHGFQHQILSCVSLHAEDNSFHINGNEDALYLTLPATSLMEYINSE